MERKTLKQFHHELSWSTRIYTLLTFVLFSGAYFFNAWNTDWVMTIVVALAIILFVESFAIVLHRHPLLWRILKWGVILILFSLLFIG